jgi:hypothetical protein
MSEANALDGQNTEFAVNRARVARGSTTERLRVDRITLNRRRS